MGPVRALGTVLDERDALAGFSRATVSMVVTNPNIDDNPIVYVNDAFERTTGYAKSAAIGRNCRFLQGEDTDKAAVDRLRRAIDKRDEVTVDILNYRANGEAFINRLIVSPVFGQDGTCLYFIGVQKELRPNEKRATGDRTDSHLQELQKRVSADLSMIIGRIRLQSTKTSIPAEFAALSRRIECLQLLYEELSFSDARDGRGGIDLGSFLARVATTICHYEGRAGIRVSIEIAPVRAGLDVATRMGLVLSEVVTNAFEHAFAGLDAGIVDIRLTEFAEGGMRLTVADDGVGIPKEVEWPSPNSMGGRIVDSLVEGLDGTVIVGRGAAGTVITIDVPAGASKE